MKKSNWKRRIGWCIVSCVCIFCFVKNSLALELNFPILIAHAGGALDGKTYLNSLEAVQEAIKNDFTYIELDLLETTDGDLVAAHDWKKFHNLTGFPEQTQPISAAEIKKRKILEKQTILTSEEIRSIFEKNKNLVLVTDKIQNIDLIVSKFSSFLDRIIVEVFTVEKYKEAKEKGILYPAFCVWNSDYRYNLVLTNEISMITLSTIDIDNHLEWFKNNQNVTALAFSLGDKKANSVEEIKKYKPFIKGWYTDFLKPKDFDD